MKKKDEIKDEDSQEGQEGAGQVNDHVESEKEKLLKLLQTLKDLGINSIGDLEVKISRL